MILLGTQIRDQIRERLSARISNANLKPILAILQVGKREDSTAYIAQKKLFAERIGASVKHIQYEETIKESALLDDIRLLNADDNIHGIILQIPIPEHLNKNTLIESIDPKKDVDGLTSANLKKLYENDPTGHMPATAKGIVTLLEHYKIPITGKKVVVVGRSSLVGKPVALALLNKDATVTVCHLETQNLEKETAQADILVVAAGHPHLITKNHVKEGQTIIDVGINPGSNGKKFVGDVDFDAVQDIVSAITPVPGGVGPLTVASLFENLVSACEKSS